MGYRSDVAYTIRFVGEDAEKNKGSFYTFLAEAKANAATAPCFNEIERGWAEFEVDEKKYHINFSTDDVKWYESYADVQCHEALLSLASEWAEGENPSDIAYRFVRIGEEPEDVEERQGGEYETWWVQVSRSISRDW